jgi:hypothetical protein
MSFSPCNKKKKKKNYKIDVFIEVDGSLLKLFSMDKIKICCNGSLTRGLKSESPFLVWPT